MTTFVVLAAGRGSRLGRIGDELPKALLPLNGRAVLSHQFDLAPPGARLVVVTGYRADQVEEYVRLAHPDLDVTFVKEVDWGRGPGASLLMARPEVGDDDLVFTACDTLWERDDALWDGESSFVAVAPIPAGTPAARWCRMVPDASGDFVARIDDKTPDVAPGSVCWTALARVARDVVERFWTALADADARAGEIQFSSGLDAVVDGGEPIDLRQIQWLDVGDERAYRAALVATTGYDPLKPDQVTYVLPDTGRVVKCHFDVQKVAWRAERAKLLRDLVPEPVTSTGQTMTAYDYVAGRSLYDVIDDGQVDATHRVLDWWADRFWPTRLEHTVRPAHWHEIATRFYRDRTFSRVMSLDPTLRSVALDAVTRVDWDALVDGCVYGTFHGDLTYANVIERPDGSLVGIDWREDFAGETTWGDLRYDLAKLLSGTAFHWGRAAYGDFRRWDQGWFHGGVVLESVENRFTLDPLDVQRLAALCLLGSAALHAAPMDEILVTRGARWLGEVT